MAITGMRPRLGRQLDPRLLPGFRWQDAAETLIVAVNYAPNQSQCHVRLPFAHLAGKRWRLQDQLSPTGYDWTGDDLQGHGLFLDMAPWQASVLGVREATA